MKNFVVMMLALILVSCGGDKKANNNPLSSEQKGVVKEVGKSTSRSLNSVSLADKNKRDGAAAFSRGAYTSGDATTDTMSQKFLSNECKTTFEMNEKNQTKSYLKMTASGSCPVTLDFYFENTVNATAGTVEMTAKMKYEVLDAEYKKMNDVTGMDFNMSGKIQAEKTQIAGSIQGSGSISSQKHDNIGLNIAFNVNGNNEKMVMESIFTMKFSNFSAELKSVTTSFKNEKTTNEYFVNGEKVSKEEYSSYLDTKLEQKVKKAILKAF